MFGGRSLDRLVTILRGSRRRLCPGLRPGAGSRSGSRLLCRRGRLATNLGVGVRRLRRRRVELDVLALDVLALGVLALGIGRLRSRGAELVVLVVDVLLVLVLGVLALGIGRLRSRGAELVVLVVDVLLVLVLGVLALGIGRLRRRGVGLDVRALDVRALDVLGCRFLARPKKSTFLNKFVSKLILFLDLNGRTAARMRSILDTLEIGALGHRLQDLGAE